MVACGTGDISVAGEDFIVKQKLPDGGLFRVGGAEIRLGERLWKRPGLCCGSA